MSATAVPLRPLAKGAVAKLWIGLAILVLIAAVAAMLGTRHQRNMDPGLYLADVSRQSGVTTTASGVRIRTVEAGTGARPAPDDLVLIEYEGRLADGSVFDSSEGRGPMPLPVTGSIPGFAEALQMMQAGGRYRIWLPPELGYGPQGTPGGPIPPNAVLDFDVHLVDVAPGAALQMQRGMQQGAPPEGME